MPTTFVREFYHEHISKFGSNLDVDAAAETVWRQGGLVNYLSSAATLNVTSDNVNDDVAGTGALTVEIFGLDTNYDRISETVILTGRVIKATSLSYLRVFIAKVKTTGSGNQNAGIIYVFTGTETTGTPDDATKIYTTIAATKNRTLQAFYTIPAGFTGSIHNFNTSTVTAQNVTVEVVIREQGTTPFLVEAEYTINASTININDLGLEIPQKTDVEIRATGASPNNIVSGEFGIELEQRV